MSLLLKLVALPLVGPMQTAFWTARKIAERAEEVYYDDGPMRTALMELELRYDIGEIDEEHFEAEEAALLERLKEIRAYKAQQ